MFLVCQREDSDAQTLLSSFVICAVPGNPAKRFAAALCHIVREARGRLAKQTKSSRGCETVQGAWHSLQVFTDKFWIVLDIC